MLSLWTDYVKTQPQHVIYLALAVNNKGIVRPSKLAEQARTTKELLEERLGDCPQYESGQSRLRCPLKYFNMIIFNISDTQQL